MTTEEKSKAYDEALERAKEMMNNDCSSETTKAVCQEIFPSLVDSENERIRKEILDFIQLCLSRTDFGSRSIALRKEDAEMFEKWIAYLEKQKEQTQPEVDLGKEIDAYLEPIEAWQIQETPYTSMENIARYFYELGRLNARKEDEI